MIIEKLKNGNVEVIFNGETKVYSGNYIVSKLENNVSIYQGNKVLFKISYDDISNIIDKGNVITVTNNNELYNVLKNDIFQRSLETQTTVSNGVPSRFEKQSSNGRVQFIQKGQTNFFRLRPSILNENARGLNNEITTVTPTNIVGQIFKHSRDNINGAGFDWSSAAGIILDDFESYADNAALQAAWIASGNLATLTTTAKNGVKAMSIPFTTLNDEWEKTIPPTNYSGYIGSFYFQQNYTYSNAKMRVFISDGINTKSAPITIIDPTGYEKINISESFMTEDGAGTTDVLAITAIGFRVEKKAIGGVAFIDDIIATPEDAKIEMKLYDFGSSIPVDSVTRLDDATQYTEIGDRGLNSGSVSASLIVNLKGGDNIYYIKDFVAGVAKEVESNTLLTIDNYYAITLHYVDTDITIHGGDGNAYNNGYAFNTPDVSTPITEVAANTNLNFQIFSTQEAYIFRIVTAFNEAPGLNTVVSLFTIGSDNKITDVLSVGGGGVQFFDNNFDIRPSRMDDGGKYELSYSDDITDSASALNWVIVYLYEDLPVNG